MVLIGILHDYAILRKKRKLIRRLLGAVRPRILALYFFTIEDVSLHEKLVKSRDKNTVRVTDNLSKVICIEREDFVYFENYINIQY